MQILKHYFLEICLIISMVLMLIRLQFEPKDHKEEKKYQEKKRKKREEQEKIFYELIDQTQFEEE